MTTVKITICETINTKYITVQCGDKFSDKFSEIGSDFMRKGLPDIIHHITGVSICPTRHTLTMYNLQVGNRNIKCNINLSDYDLGDVAIIFKLIQDVVDMVRKIQSTTDSVTSYTGNIK
jgi:hypothetical protein